MSATIQRTIGTVRVRLFLLLLVVTLPLVTLSTLTILQNAQLRHRADTEAVRSLRAAALAGGAPERIGGRVWRITADGALLPLSAATAANDAPAQLAEILTATDGDSTPSIGGMMITYAVARLANGERLLFAVPSGAGYVGPEALLGRRLTAVALLLLVGFAAVAYGADKLVAAPIRRLGRAVEQWRFGGQFAPPPDDLAGGDIRALWASFKLATESIGRRERQLQAATARQELLMQEIHHRVKNNLQIVASLLNLQASRIRVPEARAEFQTARDRIRALATLHRHLYAFGELHTINMRDFLTELCEQLLAALGETPAGGRISLSIDAPELKLSSDQAVPIALIVTECVSNAAKYAFPGGRSGHVTVSMTVVSGVDGAVGHLRIDDDGIGIPVGRAQVHAQAQAGAEGGARHGIGLNLVRGFAKQLGAVVTITHDPGTRYDIAIPLVRDRAADEDGSGFPAAGETRTAAPSLAA